MVRSVGLKGDSRVCEDYEDLDYKLSKVHLHEDTSVLFYFCYVHAPASVIAALGNKKDF